MSIDTTIYFTDEGKPDINALTAKLDECLEGNAEGTTISALWRVLTVWVRELEDTLKVENDESVELPDETTELIDMAKEHGLAFVFDHLGYDGLGNVVVDLNRQHIVLVTKLVTLVRVGFLVRVDGERATLDSVRDPDLNKMLRTIMQAVDAEDAAVAIQRENK